MPGIRTAKVTDVRQDFANFFTDAVHHDRPVIITRYKERAYLLGENVMQAILEAATTDSKGCELLPEEDGSTTLRYHPLNLAANGSDVDDAIDDLLEQIRTYAELFLEDLSLYLRDTNRRRHLPLLLAVSLFEQDEDLIKFLHLPVAE